jgi:lysophospholipase L1-like esterase
VSPDDFIIPLFYIVALVSAVLAAWVTPWSSRGGLARLGKGVVTILLAAVLFEVSSLIALRVNFGYWIYAVRANPNAWLFEQHPNMVALMMANKHYSLRERRDVVFSHNSLGFRGAEFPPKGSAVRIVAIGGSTTYGVDVSDTETWPALLQQKLGAGYEVLNLGVAGHGTAEHLYMMGAVTSRLRPDIVVLHLGLNDMHCMHSPQISPVLNKCHSDLLFLSTGQCFVNRIPRLASLHAVVSILQNLGLAPRCPRLAEGARDFSTVDAEVVQDFRARTVAIVSAALSMGAHVVVVPQVGFREDDLRSGSYRWWTPYLDQNALPALMRRFNAELKEVALKLGVTYVSSVDQTPWSDDLFVDVSHLNREGNDKLASLVATEARRLHLSTGE